MEEETPRDVSKVDGSLLRGTTCAWSSKGKGRGFAERNRSLLFKGRGLIELETQGIWEVYFGTRLTRAV